MASNSDATYIGFIVDLEEGIGSVLLPIGMPKARDKPNSVVCFLLRECIQEESTCFDLE